MTMRRKYLPIVPLMIMFMAVSVTEADRGISVPTEPAEEALQPRLDEAEPGQRVTIPAGRYEGDIYITRPNVRIFASQGAQILGTVHIEAPEVSLIQVTVISDDRCVLVGPSARGFRAYFNRLVVSSPSGVAMEISGTETAGMELFENQIYNIGGVDPDRDHRGVRHNWKPFRRGSQHPGKGIVVNGTYDGQDPPLRIHRNRISGLKVGLVLEASDTPAAQRQPSEPGAEIYRNRITSNATGIIIRADGCKIEHNQVRRSTGVGIIATGEDTVIHANRILHSERHAIELSSGQVFNNVVARNDGGIVAQGATAVAHNTFYRNEGAMLRVDDSEPVSFVNNLVDHTGRLFSGGEAIERHHNVYANGACPRHEEGLRSGQLSYRDLPAGDFRPLPDSIAVDAAAPFAEIKRDAANAGRCIGSAPDAGAFEVGPADAPAQSWWVAPAGEDETGDGSREKPFATVSRAAQKAGPGDSVYLQAGRYEGDQTITCAGADRHPIRIMPAPGLASARGLVTRCEANQPLEMADPAGGKVVVEGGSWKLVDAPHLIIEGLEFRDSPHAVIDLGARSSHVTIRECVFINCPTSKPESRKWHAGITGSGPDASHVLIENNIFDRRPNRDWVYKECDVINPYEGSWCTHWVIRNNIIAGYDKMQLGHGGSPDLITLGSPPTYHRIEGNEFFECNRAIHMKSSDNIFRGNYIHDMVPGYTRKPVGMMDRSGQRNTYDGNTVLDAPYAGIFVLGQEAMVINNVFVRCKVGVLVAMRTFGSPAGPGRWRGRTHVYHNTFVDTTRAVQVDTKRDALVYNNIICNFPGDDEHTPTAPTITGDATGVFPIEELDWALGDRFQHNEPGLVQAGYNLYWNAEPPYLRNYEGGHGNVYADPLFVNAAEDDYRLRSDSPAREAGRAINVGHDKQGRSRPVSAPDLGALQHSPLP